MQETSLNAKLIYSALITACKIISFQKVTTLVISVIHIKAVTIASVAAVVECKKIV